MAKSDKGLLFFYDWREPFKELSGDDCKSLLMAMLDYSQNDTPPPDFNGNAKIAATFLFPALERAKKCAIAGRAGGFAKANNANSGAIGGAISEILPQNKTKTKHKQNNTINSATAQTAKAVKHKYGEYNNVLLTDEELEKLKGEFPDCAERIERLSEYIASKGTAYRSHFATIRNWAKKENGNHANITVGKNGVAIDTSKNDLDDLF